MELLVMWLCTVIKDSQPHQNVWERLIFFWIYYISAVFTSFLTLPFFLQFFPCLLILLPKFITSSFPLFSFLLLDIFFICISNVIPFRSFPTRNLPSHPVPPASLSCHSPTLGHQAFTGPRDSPPTDALQSHPLLHIQLVPWVPPCVHFGWWFSSRKIWGV